MPNLVCPANHMEQTNTNQSTAMIVWEDPKATDSGGSLLEATCKPVSGSEFPIGSKKVVCKTVDKELRKALCTFEIIIKGKY